MSDLSAHVVVDPRLAHSATPAGDVEDLEETPLASLEDRLKSRMKRKPFTLSISGEGREGLAVRYDPNIRHQSKTFERWTAAATTTKADGTMEFDAVKFNCLVLADTAVALLIDGVEYATVGEPAFRNPAVHQLVGRGNAADTVQVWFGGEELQNDFEIGAHVDRVLERSGLRTEAKEAPGPT